MPNKHKPQQIGHEWCNTDLLQEAIEPDTNLSYNTLYVDWLTIHFSSWMRHVCVWRFPPKPRRDQQICSQRLETLRLCLSCPLVCGQFLSFRPKGRSPIASSQLRSRTFDTPIQPRFFLQPHQERQSVAPVGRVGSCGTVWRVVISRIGRAGLMFQTNVLDSPPYFFNGFVLWRLATDRFSNLLFFGGKDKKCFYLPSLSGKRLLFEQKHVNKDKLKYNNEPKLD